MLKRKQGINLAAALQNQQYCVGLCKYLIREYCYLASPGGLRFFVELSDMVIFYYLK